MKKLYYILTILLASLLLVSCDESLDSNHTIKIHVNNAIVETLEIEDGKSITHLSLSEIENLENFSHWTTDKNGTIYTIGVGVFDDLDLYAVFETPTKPVDPVIPTPVDPTPVDPTPVDPTPVDPTPVDPSIPTSIDFNSIKYYQGYGLDSLLGLKLREKLTKVLTDTAEFRSYGRGLNSILTQADTDPRTNKLWTIYDGASSFGNKEHVMPKSWYYQHPGYSNRKGDVHNLRVSVTATNSARSNYGFFDSTGTKWALDKDNKVFYPGEKHLGDVARIYFYMFIMVPNALNFSDDNIGSWLNNKNNAYRKTFSEDAWNLLLKWHLADPVDEFEIHRNEVLFGFQKNRNPFIDFPDLVYYTWPEHYTK